jgi:hypothetical protein
MITAVANRLDLARTPYDISGTGNVLNFNFKPLIEAVQRGRSISHPGSLRACVEGSLAHAGPNP